MATWNGGSFSPVWPDLAKIDQVYKILCDHLVFGKILNTLWQFFNDIGQFLMLLGNFS